MKYIDGFPVIQWEKLKSLLLSLPPITEQIEINQATVVKDEKLFLDSMIRQVDAIPARPNLSIKEMRYRLTCAKPAYERLLKYYYIRIKLIEA